MKNLRIVLAATLAIIAALVLFATSLNKSITLRIEGQTLVIQTSALRVSGALRSAGIELQEGDLITPDRNTFIKDGDVIELVQASKVEIHFDGQTYPIITTERTPRAWLAAAGLTLNDYDRLVINGQTYAPDQAMIYLPQYTVEVRQAVTITLLSGDSQWQFSSSEPTLGEALWEAGFILTEADRLSPGPETPLTGPISAQLVPGKQVTVEVDGQTLQVFTSAQTVGTALAQTGLSLQGLDYSIPAADQPIPADGLIRVVRVSEAVVINQQTIPYDYELQPDDEMELDQFRVIQAGRVGLQAERVRVRYEDGVEVARQVEDSWVAQEPVTRIQGYGTQIVIRTVETADGVIEYWRAVQMHATSYSPCNSDGEPGRCYPYTSLGLPVKKGVVAVIYSWYIPMGGHTVYVPGYGHAIIADVGGGIPGEYWIDLGYSDEDYVPWSEWVTVYFTTPVPPAHEIVYILMSN